MALEDRRGNRAGVKPAWHPLAETVEISNFSTQTMSYCVQYRQTSGLCLFTETKQHSWKACTNQTQWEIPRERPAAHGGRQTGSHASQRWGSFQNLQLEQSIVLLLIKGPSDDVLPDLSSAAAIPSTSSVTNQLALVKAAVLRALILIPLNATRLVETRTENLHLHPTPQPKIKLIFLAWTWIWIFTWKTPLRISWLFNILV